jgi:hypothetical protein
VFNMAMLRKRIPASFTAVRETLRLLYRSHPRAFVVSAIASLPEPLFFPAFLLVLHQLLQDTSGPASRVQVQVAQLQGALKLDAPMRTLVDALKELLAVA